jgi:predicted anti-sigma-YlaC factor YlaD
MKRLMARLMRLLGKRTCEDVVAVLHDYYEGMLDPETAAVIERHFQGCPDCKGFFETYRALVQMTGELACEDVPDEVQRRVREALEERYRGRGSL